MRERLARPNTRLHSAVLTVCTAYITASVAELVAPDEVYAQRIPGLNLAEQFPQAHLLAYGLAAVNSVFALYRHARQANLPAAVLQPVDKLEPVV